ncbi:hypothetical protein C789_3447 [Microcystis aeruginosa FACHB-905 = DIANCHI905]|nr:hypothetical protein C789_3447 [Microcystis aeruginosa FACHB-905 = DIANCHI905]
MVSFSEKTDNKKLHTFPKKSILKYIFINIYIPLRQASALLDFV